MEYVRQCEAGRAKAKYLINELKQTGNMPRFAKALREAAVDESGYGVGFISAVLEKVKQ